MNCKIIDKLVGIFNFNVNFNLNGPGPKAPEGVA